MNIIIKGADFSANNIGQLSVQPSAFTLAVLAKYSRTLSSNQTNAVNTFILGLQNSGIYNKIKHLYLPILAGSLSESFINVALAGLPTEINPNSTYHQLDAFGIKNKGLGENALASLNVDFATDNLTNVDFHSLWFNTENYTALTNTIIPIGNGSYMSASWSNITDFVGITPASNFILASSNIYNLIQIGTDYTLSIGYKNTLKGYSFLQNDKLKSYRPQEAELTLTDTYSVNDINGTMDLTGYLNSSMLKKHGLISFGKGLTNSEITQYSGLANALMTAFGVTVE